MKFIDFKSHKEMGKGYDRVIISKAEDVEVTVSLFKLLLQTHVLHFASARKN